MERAWSWTLRHLLSTDPAFLGLAGASALAGLVRGFSGFGSAMIFVPIVGALQTPAVAVVLLFLVDTAVSLPLLPPAFARCAWREVAPLGLGAALLVPAGVELLLWADPTTLRWTISLRVLVFTAVLASGWRRRGEASVPATFLIGASAGLGGGLASLYGPPVVLFWLSGHQDAAIVRANILAFFGLMTAVAAATYLMNGMITGGILATAARWLPSTASVSWWAPLPSVGHPSTRSARQPCSFARRRRPARPPVVAGLVTTPSRPP